MTQSQHYNSVHLSRRTDTGFRIDLRNITPQAVAGKSADEIGSLEVYSGNRTLNLDVIFEVKLQDPNDTDLPGEFPLLSELHLSGDLSETDYIGHRMESGRILIDSDVGHCAGCKMSGGEIRVAGNTGDRAGVEMSGGRLTIDGDAADHVGAALPGSRKGMRGGLITVTGNIGNGTGTSMRRGVIAVAGNAGRLTGWQMRAGTVVVGGCSGAETACGMNRGTVIVEELGTRPGPTFLPGITSLPGSFSLIHRFLSRNNFAGLESLLGSTRFQLYFGDQTAGGRGELFVSSANG